METMSNITLVVFFVVILISRYINSMAVKKLSIEKKAELLDIFSGFSIWSAIPLLVLIGILYFSLDYIKENNMFYFIYLLVSFMVLYVVGLQIYIFKKLHKLEYPSSYINQYMLSVFFRLIALIILSLPMIVVLFTKE